MENETIKQIIIAKTYFKQIMLILICIYAVLLVSIYAFQRKLQYHPLGKIQKPYFYHLNGFVIKKLLTKDHHEILSWYKKPSDKNSKIIVYFHGNAGNMGDRSDKFKNFAEAGYGIMAISYSGYYGSSGNISEETLINNGKAAFDFCYQQGYKPQDIILFGESLGTGIAVQLAAATKFFAVILESPYSSITSVAQKIYWFIPVKLILKDRFESIKYLPNITSPVIIFHGTADNVVPYQEGQKVFAAIKSPKELVTVKGAKHVKFDHKFMLGKISQFLDNNISNSN
jgi:fermentation-respiration switch protein FrsA (DUF1100 family)